MASSNTRSRSRSRSRPRASSASTSPIKANRRSSSGSRKQSRKQSTSAPTRRQTRNPMPSKKGTKRKKESLSTVSLFQKRVLDRPAYVDGKPKPFYRGVIHGTFSFIFLVCTLISLTKNIADNSSWQYYGFSALIFSKFFSYLGAVLFSLLQTLELFLTHHDPRSLGTPAPVSFQNGPCSHRSSEVRPHRHLCLDRFHCTPILCDSPRS